MLISLAWIKDFVKISPDISPEELGEELTTKTAEVEKVVETKEIDRQIVIAQVSKIEKHPQAQKLNLVYFKTNSSKELRVVCGADNVLEGMKTAFAPIGITLPNNLKLEAREIRGVLSEGMLCSEEELGLAAKSSGIIRLEDDAPLGISLADYLKDVKDVLFDIDNKSLTNRPDLWGHYGMAREFAAIFKTTLKNPFNGAWEKKLASLQTKDDPPILLNVEKDCSCLGFLGLSIDNVIVKESPPHIKRRLERVGLRSINNLVDISNFVMLELGHPLHIYDRKKISGNSLQVKKLHQSTEFLGLDEIKRQLVPSDTVICDDQGPLVLAGVIGGMSTAVSQETKNIFIEVANWQAAEVRKSSTRLGLRTDSSQRFEKSLDSCSMQRVLWRMVQLVRELCPQAQVVSKVQGKGFDLKKERKISLSLSKVQQVLGHSISFKEIGQILSRLEFVCSSQDRKGNFTVKIPSFRATKDIVVAADVVEEIGRIFGYKKIAPQAPQLKITPAHLSKKQDLHRKLRDFLVMHGLALEVNTYPMIGKSLLERALWPATAQLQLLNALSREQEFMRPSLLLNALNVASVNVKNFDQFRFFEIGRCYRAHKENFSEEIEQLALIFFDKDKSPFISLTDVALNALSYAGGEPMLLNKSECKSSPVVSGNWPGLHPFEFYHLQIKDRVLGAIFSLHPMLARNFKIKGNLSCAIINLSDLANEEKQIKYRPLAKFPAANFDCSVVAENHVPVADILKVLDQLKIEEIVSNKVVGVFSAPDQKTKFVTLRSSLQDQLKTIDSATLKAIEDKIVQALEQAGFPLRPA